MWAYESVFYQIYPLGFCGAPFENDGVLEHRACRSKKEQRGIKLRWLPFSCSHKPAVHFRKKIR